MARSGFSHGRRAPFTQRARAAGIPQRQAEVYPPLPRVAVGIPPLQDAEKNGAANTRKSLRSRPDLLAGRPGEPPHVCSPKRPLRGEDEPRPERSSNQSAERHWVGFSSDSGGARRPGFPHARCRRQGREPGSCSHRGWIVESGPVQAVAGTVVGHRCITSGHARQEQSGAGSQWYTSLRMSDPDSPSFTASTTALIGLF
jgi:hypothetical protein